MSTTRYVVVAVVLSSLPKFSLVLERFAGFVWNPCHFLRPFIDSPGYFHLLHFTSIPRPWSRLGMLEN
ncbi:hypothetical protein HYDPIDRAFT_114714 [Hydnomerulius pinastri MD-312]|uniref:Uncharacterized protein n=1 Tax=Hydnomerulius pinastri MD-312 TaxID=994086 RepID=A0A0C9WD79_9AGAM|nr:hypothetical protein HYDPIDRAFT_114714 [Hydnomerulius pinastri MD-312]